MRLTLAISPCPNDTFMFDALLHGRIDTEGLKFDVRFADIEELNASLLSPDGPDISKSSYAVVPQIRSRYAVLRSGSALGRGNGPLLVSRTPGADLSDSSLRIAVPGRHTTADMLLARLFPALTDRTPLLFSDIAPAVASGRFDAGVLIHEGRFVYRRHDLHLLADLGQEWERRTGRALPLGAIAIRRSLPPAVCATAERVLRRSVEYAIAHPDVSRPFVKAHARELDDKVIDSHIALFVNDYSIDLGQDGLAAVSALLDLPPESLFLA